MSLATRLGLYRWLWLAALYVGVCFAPTTQQEHELRECTFRPQTTEGANRQLLQQLLAEEDISLHLK